MRPDKIAPRLFVIMAAATIGVGGLAAPPALADTRQSPRTSIKVVDLGRPGGGDANYASLVNNNGVIAGNSVIINPPFGNFGFVRRNGRYDLIPAGFPAAINARGQIAGNIAGALNEAFLWEDGRLRLLGFLGGTPGHRASHATDINASGAVVGNSTVEGGAIHATLWFDGQTTDLGTLGGTSSWAYAINDRGQVVGQSRTATGAYHAFSWENGRMTDLGNLGGDNVSAEDVNNNGQVVGYSRTAAGTVHSFIWQHGRITDINRPGIRDSEAIAINDRGDVLLRGHRSHSSQWRAGRYYDLPGLGGDLAYPLVMNSLGQIVGSANLPNGSIHAVIWDHGSVTDLGLGEARGLNANGLVVGNTPASGEQDYIRATLWRLCGRR